MHPVASTPPSCWRCSGNRCAEPRTDRLLLPGPFVIVTVLAFNFVGDGLRDAVGSREPGYGRWPMRARLVAR